MVELAAVGASRGAVALWAAHFSSCTRRRCILATGELKPWQIGVVTPYMGQVRRLRRAISQNLRLENPRELLVASVDSFQGREKEFLARCEMSKKSFSGIFLFFLFPSFDSVTATGYPGGSSTWVIIAFGSDPLQVDLIQRRAQQSEPARGLSGRLATPQCDDHPSSTGLGDCWGCSYLEAGPWVVCLH